MSDLLHECTTLAKTGPGRYERELDTTWWGHESQFGGYVEALALTAMRTELGATGMAPATMTVQFFRRFGAGCFRAEVSVERQGRTMANTLARLYSEGRLAGIAIAAFGARRHVAEFGALDAPAEVRDQPVGVGEDAVLSTLGVPTHAHFEFFPRIGSFAPGAGAARVGGWVRPRHPGAIDELLMVVLADLWIPAAYHRWTEPAVAATIDVTTQFRAAFPFARSEGSSSEPLFVVLHTAGSIGGFVDEDCEIWSTGGVLLAQSRQVRYVHGS